MAKYQPKGLHSFSGTSATPAGLSFSASNLNGDISPNDANESQTGSVVVDGDRKDAFPPPPLSSPPLPSTSPSLPPTSPPLPPMLPLHFSLSPPPSVSSLSPSQMVPMSLPFLFLPALSADLSGARAQPLHVQSAQLPLPQLMPSSSPSQSSLAPKQSAPFTPASHAAISLTNSGHSHKQAHLTGPLALSGIKEELSNIGSIYQYSTDAKITLSNAQQKMIESQMAPQMEMDWIIAAHKTFQEAEKDRLSDEAVLAILDIFVADQRLAMSYSQLISPELCRLWVNQELCKLSLVNPLRC